VDHYATRVGKGTTVNIYILTKKNIILTLKEREKTCNCEELDSVEVPAL
jgi:hypothetical protein